MGNFVAIKMVLLSYLYLLSWFYCNLYLAKAAQLLTFKTAISSNFCYLDFMTYLIYNLIKTLYRQLSPYLVPIMHAVYQHRLLGLEQKSCIGYSGYLNTGLVWYLNGRYYSGYWMVCFSSHHLITGLRNLVFRLFFVLT